MQKYEPGDRVVIVDNFEKSSSPFGYSKQMALRAGTVMTIREVVTGMHGTYYYMYEDEHEFRGNGKPGWLWAECWIKGYAEIPDEHRLLEMLV